MSRLFALTLIFMGCTEPSVLRDDAGREITLGQVRIWTYPKGAKGWIDGELVLTRTPATLVREEGTYTLELQVPGAESRTVTVEVERGRTRRVQFDLPRPPDATVTVTSDIQGASVRINGYKRGVTPLQKVITKPGALDVTVVGPAHRARSFKSKLEIGEQKSFHVDFSRTTTVAPGAKGRLTLGMKPDGVVLDERGASLGESPLVRKTVRAGVRTLLLRTLDGRYERKVQVEVKPDDLVVYRFQLRDADEVPEGRRVPTKTRTSTKARTPRSTEADEPRRSGRR